MPTAPTLTGFTRDGALLVTVSPDHLLRVFVSATGSLHCPAIKVPSSQALQCLAIGSNHAAIGGSLGSLIICDLSLGKVVSEIAGAHSDAVNSLCFGRDDATLYSCSADGWCSEWSISAKQCRAMRKFRPSKRTATVQLEINPAGTLLACGANNIKIIDLGSLQAVAKLRGHATPIRQMRFSANGKMLYSIAHNDRVVNAFRISSDKSGKAGTIDACACYSSDERPRSLRLHPSDRLLAYVTHSGNIAVFKTISKKATGRSLTDCIKITSGSVHDVQFVANADKLVTVHGILTTPVFSVVDATAPAELPSVANGLFLPANGKKQKRIAFESPVDVINGTKSATKRAKLPESATANAPVDVPVLGEVPAEPASDEGLTADSMVALLSQALKADDADKLRIVLREARPSFIRTTVARLAPATAPTLLRVLVKRLQSPGSHVQMLSTMQWLVALLTRHATALMSASELLGDVKQVLQARLQHGATLQALSGRLQLLQIQSRLRRPQTDDADPADVPVYVDADSDDDDDRSS
ncbi:unnamed protein product (mitochondrion) [Plasmodiophora brassicae]|uniref:Small-subunit processome Utp12 domain-containing protein n=1 Tax=Plasmodiophora brassicae TaxID=37360 RepID=A0A0G4J924_PLABS|nr:hypothetical protein PBRA_003466 [Plasmodiophora brassicae]SPQ99821.1 unnamed protein product [Plasmodiophora brassicae]